MKLANSELREELAGQYVLGTLRGRARDRFEVYLRQDQDLQRRVAAWEERLHPMLDDVSPVRPGPEVWRDLVRRLGFEAAGQSAAPRWWAWRPVFGVLAVVLVVGGLSLREPVRQNLLFMPDINVTFVDEARGPLWRIEADSVNNRVEITVLDDVALDADRAMELWLLRDAGQAPVSLGLMPLNRGAVQSFRAAAQLSLGTGLAVSLEPAGGSPTGLPTGPVLYAQQLSS